MFYTIFCSIFSQPVKRQNPAICFWYFNTEGRLHLWNLLGKYILICNQGIYDTYYRVIQLSWAVLCNKFDVFQSTASEAFADFHSILSWILSCYFSSVKKNVDLDGCRKEIMSVYRNRHIIHTHTFIFTIWERINMKQTYTSV